MAETSSPTDSPTNQGPPVSTRERFDKSPDPVVEGQKGPQPGGGKIDDGGGHRDGCRTRHGTRHSGSRARYFFLALWEVPDAGRAAG